MGHFLPGEGDSHQEVLQYGVDQTLPAFQEGDNSVSWWAAVFDTGRYPALSQAVKAALSVFHGPLVESSFNMMSDIIDPRSTRMSIDTFSAIQTVKHTLLNRKQTAVEMFDRPDYKYDPVDQRLCHNMSTAGTRETASLREAAVLERGRKREYNCQPCPSAAQAKRDLVAKEKLARERHASKLRKRARETLGQAGVTQSTPKRLKK